MTQPNTCRPTRERCRRAVGLPTLVALVTGSLTGCSNDENRSDTVDLAAPVPLVTGAPPTTEIEPAAAYVALDHAQVGRRRVLRDRRGGEGAGDVSTDLDAMSAAGGFDGFGPLVGPLVVRAATSVGRSE